MAVLGSGRSLCLSHYRRSFYDGSASTPAKGVTLTCRWTNSLQLVRSGTDMQQEHSYGHRPLSTQHRELEILNLRHCLSVCLSSIHHLLHTHTCTHTTVVQTINRAGITKGNSKECRQYFSQFMVGSIITLMFGKDDRKLQFNNSVQRSIVINLVCRRESIYKKKKLSHNTIQIQSQYQFLEMSSEIANKRSAISSNYRNKSSSLTKYISHIRVV